MHIVYLNTYMENIVAINGIRDILKETITAHGWHIPEPVFEYTVRILAEKVDSMPWTPEPSYAEAYLKIKTPTQALALGNTCFFTRSVFPEIMERRGLSQNYFVELGQGSYTIVLKHTDMPHIRAIRDNFEFLSEVVYTSIRLNGEFRSMWL
jgi:hypothetical protein